MLALLNHKQHNYDTIKHICMLTRVGTLIIPYLCDMLVTQMPIFFTSSYISIYMYILSVFFQKMNKTHHKHIYIYVILKDN